MMEYKPLLEALSHLITIIGVPIAIFVFLREQHLQREEREYGTYDALDDKYIELQTLLLDYPHLDVFDKPRQNPETLTNAELRQQDSILLIRMSIYERAYLMYQHCGLATRRDQWNGWEMEIKEWLQRESFLSVWEENKAYFDKDFVSYFERQ